MYPRRREQGCSGGGNRKRKKIRDRRGHRFGGPGGRRLADFRGGGGVARGQRDRAPSRPEQGGGPPHPALPDIPTSARGGRDGRGLPSRFGGGNIGRPRRARYEPEGARPAAAQSPAGGVRRDGNGLGVGGRLKGVPGPGSE